MRYSYLFILSLFLLTFAACGNEDDDVTAEDNLIVGSWIATSGTQTGNSTTNFGSTSVSLDFTTTLNTPTTYGVVFSSAPNNVSGVGTADLETSFTIDGMPTTASSSIPLPINNGTWEVSGNTLRVNSSTGEVTEVQIIELTETTLSLGGTNTTSLNQGGATGTSVSEFNYTYERQ